MPERLETAGAEALRKIMLEPFPDMALEEMRTEGEVSQASYYRYFRAMRFLLDSGLKGAYFRRISTINKLIALNPKKEEINRYIGRCYNLEDLLDILARIRATEARQSVFLSVSDKETYILHPSQINQESIADLTNGELTFGFIELMKRLGINSFVALFHYSDRKSIEKWRQVANGNDLPDNAYGLVKGMLIAITAMRTNEMVTDQVVNEAIVKALDLYLAS